MHEDLLIIWLCWLFFIFSFFLYEDKQVNKPICLFLLLFISLSPYQLTYGMIEHSAVLIGLCLLFVYLLTYIPLRFRDMIYICVCAGGYVGLSLIELVAPVWFILPSYLIHAIILYIVIYLLVEEVKRAWVVCFLSLCIGQVIYTLILYMYHMAYVIDGEILCIMLFYTMIMYGQQWIKRLYANRKKWRFE